MIYELLFMKKIILDRINTIDRIRKHVNPVNLV